MTNLSENFSENTPQNQTNENQQNTPTERKRYPSWLKRQIAFTGKQDFIEKTLQTKNLHTVCTEAKCPNRGECYASGTATFLVMGDICTRSCSFCGVQSGEPKHLDKNEINNLVDAVKEMNLTYVVITSVTRDDLPDGGANHIAEIIKALKEYRDSLKVEVLIPDFQGNDGHLRYVTSCKPDVLNHNIETVPRLYKTIRPQADYNRSLNLLKFAAQQGCVTKSGIMVGLGETEAEVIDVIKDLVSVGCQILTIGQYLQPTQEQVPVVEFVDPLQFKKYETLGKELGLKTVISGPFVRSSYHAAQTLTKINNK